MLAPSPISHTIATGTDSRVIRNTERSFYVCTRNACNKVRAPAPPKGIRNMAGTFTIFCAVKVYRVYMLSISRKGSGPVDNKAYGREPLLAYLATTARLRTTHLVAGASDFSPTAPADAAVGQETNDHAKNEAGRQNDGGLGWRHRRPHACATRTMFEFRDVWATVPWSRGPSLEWATRDMWEG